MLETVRSFQNLRKHNFRQHCGFSLCAYGMRIPPRTPFAYACVYPAYGPIQNFLASQPLHLSKGCACDAYPSPRLVLHAHVRPQASSSSVEAYPVPCQFRCAIPNPKPVPGVRTYPQPQVSSLCAAQFVQNDTKTGALVRNV